MGQRCVLCNNVMSEEEISAAIEYADWEAFGGRGGEVYDEGGQPQPPEGANWGVVLTIRWGWVHHGCARAYGNGQTPEEQQREFVEGMMRLLHGEQGETLGQES
jgi:hypothetical protein